MHTDAAHPADLIDGFFTRPSLLRVALGRPVAPDLGRISDTLSRGGVEHLDALFVAHSHHDHVMDAPEIVKRVGGVLYGSESTVNVGRGADLGEQSMTRISDGDKYTFGDFTVRFFEGVHNPGDKYPGTSASAPFSPGPRNYSTARAQSPAFPCVSSSRSRRSPRSADRSGLPAGVRSP